MRIVIDMQGAQTGSRLRGIGRYTLSLTKAIVRHRDNHDIVLALNGLLPETAGAIRAEFGELLPPENIRAWKGIGPTREADPANRWRREVSERIREAFLLDLQPDVILVTSLFEGLGDDAACSIGLLHDTIPTAVILYDLIPLVSPDQHFRHNSVHIEWLRRKLGHLRRSHRLLAISESSRREALAELDFSEDQVVNISAACDESFRKIGVSDSERDDLWGRLGITKPYLMYAGGADASKNLPGLVMAFAQLPASLRAKHQLLLVGSMPEQEIIDLRQLARDAGLGQQDTVFTGHVADADLVKLYNLCTLFVSPSLHEGFGLPPLEAMACGAPVIAANRTSLPEVVGLHEALFDPTAPAEIAGKICQALTDEAFRRRLSSHGPEQARKFSWSRTAIVAVKALEELAAPRRSRVSTILNVERTSVFARRRLKILVIKLDHLGDFILALPAIAKLRAKYPDATIDAIVGSWNVEIARELNLFANVFAFDFFKAKSSERPSADETAWDALLSRLGKYDIAIDLRRQPEARALLLKVKASLKVGYQTLDPCVDNQLDIALRTFPDARSRRTRLNRTATSRQILALVDSLPPDVNDFVSLPRFGSAAVDDGAVAIFPKAGSDGREWGRAQFEALVERLAACSFVRRITVYFPSDADARGFKFGHRKVSLEVKLGFPGLARSLQTHAVCVANNSGGAHLAALLGVGVIGVYSGHELASEWGPQLNDGYVIHRDAACAPCHFGRRSECPVGTFCLGDISVDDVYGKTVEALQTRHRARESGAGRLDRQLVSTQRTSDSIVRELLSSIASLIRKADQATIVRIADALAQNHPRYTVGPGGGSRSITPNVTLDHKSTLIEWKGFSGSEPEFRWTDGPEAAMEFYCEYADEIPASGVLTLVFDTYRRQRIGVRLNGIKVTEDAREGAKLRLEMRVLNLRAGRNKLEFDLPDASVPGNGDFRRVGIAVRSFRVSGEEPVRFGGEP